MARSVGNTIPAQIRPLLDGNALETREGVTFLLLTSSDDGWPHLAMLSVGELLAVGDRELRAALWPGSTAATNLARTGQATLALVHDEAGYYLRCSAEAGPDLPIQGGRLAYFELRVEDALEDVVPYARLTSGVTFHLNDPNDVLPRWRETVEALRMRSEDRGQSL
jgi:hypothetical protein